MSNRLETALQNLVEKMSQLDSVRAIGLSGGNRPFPEPGDGDIDLFLYCTEIPSEADRKAILALLGGDISQIEVGKLARGHWGTGDCLLMEGVETWLLYFTVAEARLEMEAILDGQYPDRLDNYYYPMGRCAMWKTMRVYYDLDGFLYSIQARLAQYSPKLRLAVKDYHLKALDDTEDLKRAVQRRDVFFYHFAMDLALDHFLQALFALNGEYFPSRKRSESYLQPFKHKPANCAERLRQVIALGGNAETLEQSYKVWKNLVTDVCRVAGDSERSSM